MEYLKATALMCCNSVIRPRIWKSDMGVKKGRLRYVVIQRIKEEGSISGLRILLKYYSIVWGEPYFSGISRPAVV